MERASSPSEPVLSALRVSGGELKAQKFVFLRAGSASIGLADYLRRAVVAEGVSDEEAHRQFWIVDKVTPHARHLRSAPASLDGPKKSGG
jgi:malic enzyme